MALFVYYPIIGVNFILDYVAGLRYALRVNQQEGMIMNTERRDSYLNVLRSDGKNFLIFKPRIKAGAYERTISMVKFARRPPLTNLITVDKDLIAWQCVYCRHIIVHEFSALGYHRDFSSDTPAHAVFRLRTPACAVFSLEAPEVEKTPKTKPDSKLFAAGVVLAVLALLAWSVSGLWGALS